MKKFMPLIFCVILALAIIFMPVYNAKGVDITKPSGEKVVLTLWHCDMVYGGKNSRATVLKDIAYGFHQWDGDTYIMITSYSYEEMLAELKSGRSPDLISFGNGGQELLPYLAEYNGKVAFCEGLESAVSANGRIMAVPWCYGKYFKVLGEKGNSYSDDCLIPYALSGVGLSEKRADVTACYDTFISQKKGFVGSNRELSKIITSVNNGKITEPEVVGSNEYTDLVNAIGIAKATKYKEKCQAFLEYIQTERAQSHISRLNLFSAVGYKLYGGTYLGNFEDGLEELTFESVFLSKSEKGKAIALAEDVVEGQKELNELKRLLESYN